MSSSETTQVLLSGAGEKLASVDAPPVMVTVARLPLHLRKLAAGCNSFSGAFHPDM